MEEWRPGNTVLASTCVGCKPADTTNTTVPIDEQATPHAPLPAHLPKPCNVRSVHCWAAVLPKGWGGKERDLENAMISYYAPFIP